MSESSDKQIEEIKEACLSSYKTGYREGYKDACEQFRQGINECLAGRSNSWHGLTFVYLEEER